jgi:dipeptidyl aminopeptidase/acylaminoacyl peptidase
MIEDFKLKSSFGNYINITCYGFENLNSAPCLIYVHGFKGFKDWGFVPYLASYFSKNGFCVLTFNFSHNGVGTSLTEFDELDKFSKNTISLEISELSEIVDAYKSGFFEKNVDGRLGFIGHSRGGAVSLLTAANQPELRAVAVWCSVAKLDRYTERQKNDWREKGFVEVLNSRTKQLMRMNVSLLDDIEQNIGGSLNIENSVKNIGKPLLIVHGEQDVTVPITEAEQIFKWSDNSLSEFIRIPSTGHTFNVEHPFRASNDRFELVLEKTKDFFKKNLIAKKINVK